MFSDYTWIKKTLLGILLSIFIFWSVCIAIEFFAISKEYKDVQNAVRLASKDAQSYFQSVNFSKTENPVGDYSLEFNIANAKNKANYEAFLNSIKSQGIAQGLYKSKSDEFYGQTQKSGSGSDTEFKKIVDTLTKDKTEYLQGKSDWITTPFQFSLTYLCEDVLSDRFEQTAKQIIDTNYSSQSLDRGILGQGNAKITKGNAKLIEGPTLMSLSNAIGAGENTEKYRTYVDLFGTSNQSALNMTNNSKSFVAVVFYDVEYTVSWQHSFKTPIFNVHNSFNTMLLKNLKEKIPHDKMGFLVIPMWDVTYRRTYSVFN